MEKKKKGAGILLLKLLAVVLALAIFSAVGLIIYRPQIVKTDLGSYIDKLERLKSTEGQKAVFIGGSSTKFSIRTAQFEQQTGIPSVNMGLNAGIAFSLYVNSVLPYIHEGDYVFLAPEYAYYSDDYNKLTESSVNFILYLNPDVMSTITPQTYLTSAQNIINVGWKNWGYYAQETLKSLIFKEGLGVYYRNSMNENGDMVAHKDLPGKTIHAADAFSYTDTGFITDFSQAIGQLRDLGATVFLLYPTYERQSFDASRDAIAEIDRAVRAIDGATVLGRPEDCSYTADHYFDTVYHLNYDSGITHTDKLIGWFEDAVEGAAS